jgi:hypothetical protein
MRKTIGVAIMCLAVQSFVFLPTVQALAAADTTATMKFNRFGKSVQVTQQQLDDLKKQPGIGFSETLPTILPEGQMAVAVPAALGGGYLIGTPAAIAAAFNAAGITVGLTAAAVSGAIVATTAGIAIAGLAGIIAAANSSNGGNGTTTTHGTTSHHGTPSHH